MEIPSQKSETTALPSAASQAELDSSQKSMSVGRKRVAITMQLLVVMGLVVFSFVLAAMGATVETIFLVLLLGGLCLTVLHAFYRYLTTPKDKRMPKYSAASGHSSQTSSSESPSPSKNDKDSSWSKVFAAPGWGIILLFLIFKGTQPWVGTNSTRNYLSTTPALSSRRPHDQTNRFLRNPYQNDFLSSIRAKNSANYWRVTVSDLHTLRFADPPANSEESANAYYARFQKDFERTLQSAQSASPAQVDPDLITMSQAHLESDAQLVNLFHELQELSSHQASLPGDETLRERRIQEEQLLDSLVNLTDEEFAALPEQTQQILLALVQLMEMREQQYREIEIMQARLSERYPGQSFTLPELVSAAE